MNCNEFLKKISEYFNIILYTRLDKQTADNFLNENNLGKYFQQKRYQQDCINHPADGFIKDLAYISDIDLLKTIMIDNKHSSVQLNKRNSIVLFPDETLEELIEYLIGIVLDQCRDVRTELEQNNYTDYD